VNINAIYVADLLVGTYLDSTLTTEILNEESIVVEHILITSCNMKSAYSNSTSEKERG